MRENKNDIVFNAFLDFEFLVQEYRKAVLWIAHGNHEATPSPSVQEMRDVMRELKEKITALLELIEVKTQ
jgi:hypothetical protein